MGVKEYRFLTTTMKTIGTRSNKLVKAKKRLRDLEEAGPNPELNKLRKRARRLRAERKKEFKRIKTGLGHVKEDTAQVEKKLEQLPKRDDWGSTFDVQSEIEAINAELKATTFFFRLFNSESIIKPKRQRMQVLKNRVKILRNDDKGRSMLESQLRTIGNQRHNLEYDLMKWDEDEEISKLENRIKDLVNLRDSKKRSTKKEIKLLEKEIPQLWDSIAHLIPFSTALEKA